MGRISRTEGSSLKREILGIILVAFAALLALSLFSFNPDDPSFNHQPSEPQKASNLAGFVGAHLADLFFQTFGLTSFLWPFFFIFLSLKLFLFSAIPLPVFKVVSSAGLFVAASGMLSLGLRKVNIWGERIDAGGALGYFLARLAEKYLNISGAAILFSVGLLISLMVLTELSWAKMIRAASRFFLVLWQQAQKLGKRLEEAKRKQPKESKKEKESAPPLIIKKEGAEQKEAIGVASPPVVQEKQEHFTFLDSRGSYVLPPLSLLESPEQKEIKVDQESLTV